MFDRRTSDSTANLPDDDSELRDLYVPCAPIPLGDEYSRGAFGTVHVVETPTGRVAIKRVLESVEYTNRELDTYVRVASAHHPHIVPLLGYWTEHPSESTRHLYLVMEFMPDTLGGILARLAFNEMRMKRRRMSSLMGQLASALEHLEHIHLMHRDLKPDNVLVHLPSDRLKLADFGSAKFHEPNQPSVTYICTRFYRAPELILNRSLYSTSVDIWSFGCILGEFAKGRPLFTGETQTDVLSSIMRSRGMLTNDDIARMPTHRYEPIDADGLLGNMSIRRKPWSEVFSRRLRSTGSSSESRRRVVTSYGRCYEQVLDGCLQWNPSSRLSASSLRRHALFDLTTSATDLPERKNNIKETCE